MPAQEDTPQDLLTQPLGERDLPATSDIDAGTVLADRYRIVRFIARGGMGEVFEAEDLTLHGTLALKTIRPEIARDRDAVARFKREIHIARRITHPNVSRIYDIGVHRHDGVETMFLTMEFLAGETLGSRIGRCGRMSEAEALPLAEQIAAGLGAAHDCGVIHRDFKSANVMLVDGARGLRAIVTDFGLARGLTTDDGLSSISISGAVMGTPAYMAPEQVEGAALTPAADIYALGIVLYEMVTQKRPFQGDTPLSLAVKRLTDPPVPPTRFVPDLDPVWEAVILRCLARRPEDRYQHALEVVRDLRERNVPPRIATGTHDATVPLDVATRPVIPTPPPAETVPLPQRRKSIVLPLTVAAAIVLAALGWQARSWLGSREVAPIAAKAARIAVRPAVAVLTLNDRSGKAEAAWYATALQELLVADLSAGEKLRVASAERVAQMERDLAIDKAGTLTSDDAKRIGRYLGVQTIVTGTYSPVTSELIRVELHTIDVAGGARTAAAGASGTSGQLFDLAMRAGDALRTKLGLPARTPIQAVELRAHLPSSPEAARLYSAGLASLRAQDPAAARNALTAAARAESHPFIHAALSRSCAALGDATCSQEQAQRALDTADALTGERKLELSAALSEALGDWNKTLEHRQALRRSFPDDIDYGVLLAGAQIAAGRNSEALVTIAELRKLPPPLSADGRIDLAEAAAYQASGDLARQKQLAAQAAVKGRAAGARHVVARARLLEATAHLHLGDLQSSTAAADEARILFIALGDRDGVARVLEHTAQVVSRQGDLRGERRLQDQALAIYKETGQKAGQARVLLNIGMLLVTEGRAAEAEKYFADALAVFRESGSKYAAAIALNNIGGMLFNRGNLVAAQKRYQDALDLFAELRDKQGTATVLTNIAEILECRGELDESARMHEEALAIYRAGGDRAGEAYILYRLAEIFAVRGQLVAARDRYQQAATIQSSVGDKLGAADSRLGLAAIAIANNDPAPGEQIARESEEILRTEGAADRSLYAQAVIADALLARGKAAEGLAVVNRAWGEAAKTEDRRVRYKVAMSRARAMAAAKNTAGIEQSLAFLETIIADARKTSFVVAALEARLTAAEIALAAGKADARKRLAAVERDASARGLTRIAQRAASV